MRCWTVTSDMPKAILTNCQDQEMPGGSEGTGRRGIQSQKAGGGGVGQGGSVLLDFQQGSKALLRAYLQS